MGGVGRRLASATKWAVLAVFVGLVAADTTPPYFYGGFPAASAIQGTTFTLDLKLNEASTVYYYVVSGASPPTPTAEQVAAQYDAYQGQSVKTKGTTSAVADVEVSVTLSGFTDNEVLSVFVAARDGAGNLQGAATKLDLIMGDDSPPLFETGFPAADEIRAHSFELLVTLNEAGTVHYAVLPQTSDAPTVEQLMAGTHPDAVACSPSVGVYVPKMPYYTSADVFHVRHNVAQPDSLDVAACQDSFYGLTLSDGLSGGALEPKCRRCPMLQNETTYDLYVVAEDDNAQTAYFRTNNIQLAPTMVTVFMADVTPPLYLPAGEYPLIRNLSPFAIDLAVSLSEPGTAFYVVVPSVSAPPTAAQVHDLVGSYGGVTVLKSGSWAVPVAGQDYGISVTGLDDELGHSAYVVVQDDGNTNTSTNMYHSNAPNLQLHPNRMDFITQDGSPPLWRGTYTPTLSAIAGTSFSLDAQLDEPGNVYYIVLRRTSDALPTIEPTSAQVFAGDFPGTAACGAFQVSALDTNFSKAVTTTAEPETEVACTGLADFYGVSLGGLTGSGLCSACPIIESQSRYWVYVVADDTDGNMQAAPRRLAVDTTDITPPSFEAATPEVVSNVPTVHAFQPNLGGVTLSVTTELDEPGRAYYLVAPASAAAPTAEQVRTCGATRDGNMRSTAGFTYAPPDNAAAVAPFVCGVKAIVAAHTLYTMDLEAVPSETEVRVYVVADDLEDARVSFSGLLLQPPVANLQLQPVHRDVRTADITPPLFVDVGGVVYPSIPWALGAAGIAGDQVTLEVAMNEVGYVYYVVVPKGFTFNDDLTDGSARSLPTATEVKAGTGPGGEGQAAHGTFAITAADTVTSHVTAAGLLTSETAYDVYLVAEDNDHPGDSPRNIQRTVTFLEFRTRDVTPPAWTPAHPTLLRGGRALEVIVQMNEPGQAFFIVVADGSPAPTSAEVVSGATYSGVVVHALCGQAAGEFDMPHPSEVYSCSVAGLEESTKYDVYVVARDDEDNSLLGGQAVLGAANLQLTPVRLDVTTMDTTAPAHQPGTPRVEALNGDSFDLIVKFDEPGMAFYTVDSFESPAPAAEYVRLGLDHVGSYVSASGNVSIPVAFTATLGFVGNQLLVSERDYYVYVTAEDVEEIPNLQQSLEKIHIRTPDVTPPRFVGRWTENGTVTAVTGYGFDLVVALDEAGTSYYVVVLAGAPAPTALDVRRLRAGDEGSGVLPPVACGVWQQPEGFANFTAQVRGVNVTERPECAADDGFYGLATGQESFYGLGGAVPFCSRCPTLDSQTAYDVWIVAEDDGGHGIPAEVARDKKNMMAKPERVLVLNYPATAPSVITADVTAPRWTLATPFPTDFFGTGFDLVVALDEPGMAWYAVTKNGVCDTWPTQAQIRSGTDGCNNTAQANGYIIVPRANVTVQHSVHNVGTHTRSMDLYIVWMYAEDNEPTLMSSLQLPNRAPVLDGFVATTTDIMNPLYDPGFPTVGNPVSQTGYGVLKTTFDVTVAMDEAGTAHYVAFPAFHALPENKGSELAGSRVPTATQIKAGQDYKGRVAAVRGTWVVSTANTPYTTTTTNVLTDSTMYNVYVAVEDNAGQDGRPHKYGYDNNLMAHLRALEITTADGTAPLFTGNPCNSSLDEICPSELHSYAYEHSIFPHMSQCGADTFTLTVNVDEAGSTVYYMVVGYTGLADVKTARDPTNEQVANQAAYTSATDGSITPLTYGAINAPVKGNTYSKAVTFSNGAISTSPDVPGFYQVFVTTKGPSGNLGDGDVKRSTFTNPTKMAPCLVTSAAVSGINVDKNVTWVATDTTLEAKVHLTAPAIVHYVLLRAGSPAPNPTQILNAKDSANATSVCYDRINTEAPATSVRCYFADNSRTDSSGSTTCPNTATDGTNSPDNLFAAQSPCTVATFANLSRGETYDLHTVITHVNDTTLSDNTGPDGPTVFYAEFTRVPERNPARTTDTLAPFFKPGYPRITKVRGDSFMLVVQLDEPGTVYYAVDEGGSTTPTTAQIIAGQDANGSPTKLIAKGSMVLPTVNNVAANFEPYNLTISGLHPKSTYDLYITAVDDDVPPYGGNAQLIATQLTFKAASKDAHMGGLLARTEDGAGVFTDLRVQPRFKQSIYFYQAFVGVGTSTVLITPISNDTESSHRMYVNGTLRPSLQEFAVVVPHGKTVFEIKITAGDTETHMTYIFAITRAKDDTVTNATLTILDITFDDGTSVNSTMMGGRSWPRCVKGCDAHAPARCSLANPECIMDSQLTEYIVRIPVGVMTMNVSATAAQPQSNVQLYTLGTAGVNYPGGLPGYTTGKPLLANPAISLYSLASNGGNTIDLVVTAGDGVTRKTYTISVERFGPGVYGEGWKPVVPTTAMVGDRYGQLYGGDDPLTTRVGIDPTVRDLTVIPALDIAPPHWITTYPRTVNATASTVELVVQLDEPGVVYFLIVPDAARVPTSREVRAGITLRPDAVSYGSITSLRALTQEVAVVVPGLSAVTAYAVWFVAEDKAIDLMLSPKPNLQPAPVRSLVTTPAP